MIDALSKAFFHALAGSPTLKRAASAYGLRSPRSFGGPFLFSSRRCSGIARRPCRISLAYSGVGGAADAVMTSGGFGGIHARLLARLAAKEPAR